MKKEFAYALIFLVIAVGLVVSVKALNADTKGWEFFDDSNIKFATIDPIDPPTDIPAEGQDVYADDIIMRSPNGDKWILDVNNNGELIVKEFE